MTEICETRVRYGYRRVHVLLRREGWILNHKMTHRIYTELGLQLRNKTPKRRVKAKLQDDRQRAVAANETWAMDFVHTSWRRAGSSVVLTIVDTFSRFSPVLDVRFSYRAEDVVQTLDRVCPGIGYPKTIRVDQGSEFISRHLDLWAYRNLQPSIGLGRDTGQATAKRRPTCLLDHLVNVNRSTRPKVLWADHLPLLPCPFCGRVVQRRTPSFRARLSHPIGDPKERLINARGCAEMAA